MNEQLMMMGFGVSLPEKVQKAIGNFRLYEKEALRRDPENGYYLCDSYGKDSGVILDLAKRSGVRFVAHHNLTTLDPPELIYHGRKHHPETIEHKPAVPMLVMMATTKGPPTRLSRWCCEKYKEHGGRGLVRVTGVRAAESAKRAKAWRVWQVRREGDYMLNPILYWTDDDVWRYTRERGLAYCDLYDNGFSRLGCIGCPMGGKNRRRDFARWPKYEAAWKRAFERFWDKNSGTLTARGEPRWIDRQPNIKKWQDLWRWWLEELPPPEETDCQMGLF
jgi:phosphoadenosine phosphosulfate reductase